MRGRPTIETTPYKIIVHTNNGRSYAAIKICKVDAEGDKPIRHWGTVDENNRFHPNVTFYHTSVEERKKLIFPAGWNLSEIGKMSGNDQRGRIVYRTGG